MKKAFPKIFEFTKDIYVKEAISAAIHEFNRDDIPLKLRDNTELFEIVPAKSDGNPYSQVSAWTHPFHADERLFTTNHYNFCLMIKYDIDGERLALLNTSSDLSEITETASLMARKTERRYESDVMI